MAGSFSPNKRSVDVSNLPDQELSYFLLLKEKTFHCINLSVVITQTSKLGSSLRVI